MSDASQTHPPTRRNVPEALLYLRARVSGSWPGAELSEEDRTAVGQLVAETEVLRASADELARDARTGGPILIGGRWYIPNGSPDLTVHSGSHRHRLRAQWRTTLDQWWRRTLGRAE